MTCQWRSDYSYAIVTFGVAINEESLARADQANARLIAEAQKNFERAKNSAR